VLLELLLGLDEKLFGDLLVGVGDTGQHQELITAVTANLLLGRVGRSAVLA